MASRALSGRVQRGRDAAGGDAGTPDGATAGRSGRTSGSAGPAGRRPSAGEASVTRDRHRDQRQQITRAAAGVNPDASLFLVAPGSGPSGRHARAGLAGSPGSAGRPLEASRSGAAAGAAADAVDLPAVAAAADDHLRAAADAHEQTARDRLRLSARRRQNVDERPRSAGYSSCIRARHDVGHGVDDRTCRLSAAPCLPTTLAGPWRFAETADADPTPSPNTPPPNEPTTAQRWADSGRGYRPSRRPPTSRTITQTNPGRRLCADSNRRRHKLADRLPHI